MDQLPADFYVNVMTRNADVQVFATRCMSLESDASRLEIHALCRSCDRESCRAVDVLTSIAHYHRTGRQVGLGHSVNFGVPWASGSRCTYGLLSLPYLDGPKLEWMEEPKVQFLWLIPITPEEVNYKKTHGADALEQRFEDAQFNYLDPMRGSVV